MRNTNAILNTTKRFWGIAILNILVIAVIISLFPFEVTASAKYVNISEALALNGSTAKVGSYYFSMNFTGDKIMFGKSKNNITNEIPGAFIKQADYYVWSNGKKVLYFTLKGKGRNICEQLIMYDLDTKTSVKCYKTLKAGNGRYKIEKIIGNIAYIFYFQNKNSDYDHLYNLTDYNMDDLNSKYNVSVGAVYSYNIVSGEWIKEAYVLEALYNKNYSDVSNYIIIDNKTEVTTKTKLRDINAEKALAKLTGTGIRKIKKLGRGYIGLSSISENKLYFSRLGNAKNNIEICSCSLNGRNLKVIGRLNEGNTKLIKGFKSYIAKLTKKNKPFLRVDCNWNAAKKCYIYVWNNDDMQCYIYTYKNDKLQKYIK